MSSPSADELRTHLRLLLAELRDACDELSDSTCGPDTPALEARVCAFAREARQLGATVERGLTGLRDSL